MSAQQKIYVIGHRIMKNSIIVSPLFTTERLDVADLAVVKIGGDE